MCLRWGGDRRVRKRWDTGSVTGVAWRYTGYAMLYLHVYISLWCIYVICMYVTDVEMPSLIQFRQTPISSIGQTRRSNILRWTQSYKATFSTVGIMLIEFYDSEQKNCQEFRHNELCNFIRIFWFGLRLWSAVTITFNSSCCFLCLAKCMASCCVDVIVSPTYFSMIIPICKFRISLECVYPFFHILFSCASKCCWFVTTVIHDYGQKNDDLWDDRNLQVWATPCRTAFVNDAIHEGITVKGLYWGLLKVPVT